MNAIILDSIRQIASDLFAVPVGEIATSSSPQTVAAWDSIQHLNLALTLEQVFGVRFTPADLEGMKSIGSIVDIVEGKNGSGKTGHG
jgi:acyl carrier protein